MYKGKHGLIVLNLCSRKAQIQSFKLKDLKLKNCLDFKTDELRSGCMQAEENAESVTIFRFQACCPLYTEGIVIGGTNDEETELYSLRRQLYSRNLFDGGN